MLRWTTAGKGQRNFVENAFSLAEAPRGVSVQPMACQLLTDYIPVWHLLCEVGSDNCRTGRCPQVVEDAGERRQRHRLLAGGQSGREYLRPVEV
jgi:hypothetical protein